jgi:hypothetical protein
MLIRRPELYFEHNRRAASKYHRQKEASNQKMESLYPKRSAEGERLSLGPYLF